VGRLTAWDGPMSVPVSCSHGGGRDKVGIRAWFSLSLVELLVVSGVILVIFMNPGLNDDLS